VKMKYLLSVTVAALLTALSVQAASAQATSTVLTNADVIRFVAMGLSDQVVKTLIDEAKVANATKFDLSPSAVSDLAAHGVLPAAIAAMRQPSTPTPPPANSNVVTPNQSPTAPPLGAATAALTTDPSKELYWRERRRVIDAKLNDDVMAQGAAINLVNLMIETGVTRRDPTAWVLALNDDQRWTDVVADDVSHLVPNFFAEGKRAGVPQEWLRPSDGSPTAPREIAAADRLERATSALQTAQIEADNRVELARQQQIDDTLWFVKSVTFGVTETNKVFMRYGWTVTIKNGLDRNQAFDFIVQFLDKDGLMIDSARVYGETIAAFDERTINGDKLVSMPGGSLVAKVQAVATRKSR
jgi:hypothetical protein